MSSTARRFLNGYAKRSDTTPEALLEAGEVVVQCDCGAEDCEGFALEGRTTVEHYRRMGHERHILIG